VLVLDNGEPSFVILDYRAYRDIVSSSGEVKEIKVNHLPKKTMNGPDSTERETEILERLNKEILALKNQIEIEERATGGGGLDY